MVHAKEEAFEAAKFAYTLCGWLLQEMAKEVGWETVIRAHSRVGDHAAGVYDGLFKGKSSGAKVGTGAIAAALTDCYSSFGSDHSITETDNTVAVHTERCPIYEGLTAAGLDHATIEKLCCGSNTRAGVALREQYPDLKLTLKFREPGEEACVEEFVLAK